MFQVYHYRSDFSQTWRAASWSIRGQQLLMKNQKMLRYTTSCINSHNASIGIWKILMVIRFAQYQQGISIQ